MTSLGDFFPNDERNEFAARYVTPGKVLKLYCSFTNPPKDKRLVLIRDATIPWFFLINSGINDFIKGRSTLLSCQFKLIGADHDYLDHDSYMDCSDVKRHFSRNEIEAQIMSDVSRVLGEIDDNTKKAIIALVASAITLNKREKDLITKALS